MVESVLYSSFDQSCKKASCGHIFDENKKNLVLELRQTLVHLTMDLPGKETNFVTISNKGTTKCCYAVPRLGLDVFMKEASSFYNVSIYTSKTLEDAEILIKALGLAPYISKVFACEDCTQTADGKYIKSIEKLGFSLSDTIFIDTSPEQITHQPLNSILIQAFKGEADDIALSYLTPFLRYMASLKDVRPVTEKLFAFHDKPKVDRKQRRSSLSRPSSKQQSTGLPAIREERNEEERTKESVKKLVPGRRVTIATTTYNC